MVVWEAMWWGLISAISLPLGALVGLWWRPGSRWTSAMMAFGAGALLFALTVELLGKVPDLAREAGSMVLVTAVVGAIIGGVIFDAVNQLLNNRGAFLRNLSNAERYIAVRKRRRAEHLVRAFSQLESFAEVPPHALAELAKSVRVHRANAGEKVYTVGDHADFLYYVERGAVMVEQMSGEHVSVAAGEIFGDTAVVLDSERVADAVAQQRTDLLMLAREVVHEAMAADPALRRALLKLTRARPGYLGPEQSDQLESALDELEEDLIPVTEADIADEGAQVGRGMAVAMAIWLGIAIDAVPESLVIGSMAVDTAGVSLAFVVGVFLANFPEALSSAVTMRDHGMSIVRIMTMWTSIVVITAAGAAFGAMVFPSHEDTMLAVVAVEALAAGAMLTAIAESMLPEAYEQGGALVGMATLLGFLCALSVSAL